VLYKPLALVAVAGPVSTSLVTAEEKNDSVYPQVKLTL
jgi:hypothetical protein